MRQSFFFKGYYVSSGISAHSCGLPALAPTETHFHSAQGLLVFAPKLSQKGASAMSFWPVMSTAQDTHHAA